jgi:hypothetical protein
MLQERGNAQTLCERQGLAQVWLILAGLDGEIASRTSLFPIAPAELMLMTIIRKDGGGWR